MPERDQIDRNILTDKPLTIQESTMDECRNRILSDDYADFIIEFSDYPGIAEKNHELPCEQGLPGRFSFVHVPREGMTIMDLLSYKYYSIPKLYGLMQVTASDAANATKLQNQPSLTLKGQGVIVGFIDTGINYQHKAFRYTTGETRIDAIWDQTIQSDKVPSGFYYGTEYLKADIDEALRSDDPYSIVPSRDDNGHGTFMAGVAAGSQDIQNDFIGAAPEATIAMVKLKPAKSYLRDLFLINEGTQAYQENDIMLAIDYLVGLGIRLKKPVVIMLGAGTNQGNHTGRSPLGYVLNNLSTAVGFGVVIAGGNEGNKRHHYHGTFLSDIGYTGYNEVEINVGKNENGFTVELWGNAPEIFSVSIVSPTGETYPRIPAELERVEEVHFLFDPTVIYVSYEIVEVRTGDQLILMNFRNPSEGIWRVRVYGSNVNTGNFHMWLPIETFVNDDTVFMDPNPYTTLTEPSNAFYPITVSGYNSVTSGAFPESGRGFAMDNSIKPNFAAPAMDVLGPNLRDGYTVRNGTSIAAAITAGCTAQFIGWDIVHNGKPTMSTIDAKNYWIRGARRVAGTVYPNREVGFGTLDAFNAFEVLLQR